MDSAKVVTAEDNWTYGWVNLPLYEVNGDTIIYRVEEEAIDNYTSVVTGFNITNTITKNTPIEIDKIWKVPTGTTLPDEIQVKIIQNGTPVDTVTITYPILKVGGGDRWTFSEEYPQYSNDGSIEYSYTVEEIDIPGYTKKVEGEFIDGQYLFTITNTLITGTPTTYLEVTLPPVEFKCISLDPVPGSYYIEEGGCFTFRFLYEDCCELPYAFNTEVKVNGTVITPDAEGTYLICDIHGKIDITITPNDRPSEDGGTVGIDDLNGNLYKVWSDKRQVYIQTSVATTASVYNLTGQVVLQRAVSEGETLTYAGNQGLYIVKFSDGTVKRVVIK